MSGHHIGANKITNLTFAIFKDCPIYMFLEQQIWPMIFVLLAETGQLPLSKQHLCSFGALSSPVDCLLLIYACLFTPASNYFCTIHGLAPWDCTYLCEQVLHYCFLCSEIDEWFQQVKNHFDDLIAENSCILLSSTSTWVNKSLQVQALLSYVFTGGGNHSLNCARGTQYNQELGLVSFHYRENGHVNRVVISSMQAQ